MKFDDLYVSGTGLYLADRLPAEDAVAAGLVDARAVRRAGLRSVCVSASESGPELAVHAATAALKRSTVRPEDLGLVLHACTWYQGHDLWAPASFVQDRVAGNRCPSMEVRQLSNGGLAAVELAAAYLLADRSRGDALVTTGDRFAAPAFDRFHSDPGTICGDGGAAVLLSTRHGFARLLSLVSVSDPGLEAMGRGDDPFATVPMGNRTPVSVDGHRSRLTRELGMNQVLARMRSGQQEAFRAALEEAGRRPDDVHRFVLPNLGRPRMQALLLEPLQLQLPRTTWEWGMSVGHLGAGDQLAGLAHLADTGDLERGDVVALLGAGAGFSWTVAVLEVDHRPPRE